MFYLYLEVEKFFSFLFFFFFGKRKKVFFLEFYLPRLAVKVSEHFFGAFLLSSGQMYDRHIDLF